ncbi:MAG TPA: cupin domain-containing protein [Petrimonas sp.]|uniref:helix-turn-helix domain-containing protein n=1 Tax=Petrimonas sp. TaxID=2023866 RepID=UPI0017608A14|nr:cupin domain-containing protein [Petrimonas sp.]MEA5064011.1 cupin domain-containing protein [Petrimonas sp.]HHV85475.1 cupin domain-containing protein [Petrimonas sp.]
MNPVTEKIKILCADKNIPAEELAKNAGLTVKQVQLIFDSEKIPSLSSLIKISRALGVRLGTFLDDNENIGPVINKNSTQSRPITFTSHLTSDNSHIDFFSLAASKSGRHMEPFLIDIKPSSSSKLTASSHEGEEFLYVLKGSITVLYGLDEFVLNTGESIYYDSIVEHLVTSANDDPAQVLAVVYTPN